MGSKLFDCSCCLLERKLTLHPLTRRGPAFFYIVGRLVWTFSNALTDQYKSGWQDFKWSLRFDMAGGAPDVHVHRSRPAPPYKQTSQRAGVSGLPEELVE